MQPRDTGLYYLQSRYYDPRLGRFINADAFTSTGQGILGYNMFAYCGNNPVIHIDPSGTDYHLVGGGLQFEIDWGGATVGVEVVIYWDVDECEDRGFQIAVYCYGGVSLEADNPIMASIIATVMDNIDILVNGSEAEIIAMATLLSNELSFSVSGVAIMGNENFTSTESYTEEFTSVGVCGGGLKGGFAYSNSCFALSLGRQFDLFQPIPSLSVSNTYYVQILEFNTADFFYGICRA